MQFSSLLLALVASKVISAQTQNQAIANANANGNVNSTNINVSANANAGNVVGGGPVSSPEPSPTYGAPNYGEYPGYSDGSNYPGCTTTSVQDATLTITDLTVSTYCAECDVAKQNGGVYTTTYCTVYSSICETGLTDITYTVTQTCTGTTPIDYGTPAPGYEVVTTTCAQFTETPTYTITQPCDCTSTPVYTPTYTPTYTPCDTCHETYVTPTPYHSAYPSVVVYTGAASTMGAVSAIAGVISVFFFGMILL